MPGGAEHGGALAGVREQLPDEVATPDEVSIENVVWYYKPEQSFKRILEYFDGEERQGRKTIIRPAGEYLPGREQMGLTEIWRGLRPATPDGP